MEKKFKINGKTYVQWFKYGIEFLTPENIYNALGWIALWNMVVPILDFYPDDPISVLFPEEWHSDAELAANIMVKY